MTRTLLLIFCLAAGTILAGALPSEAADEPNRWCPVMPGTEVDPEFFLDHEGERIYFCCDRCRFRFLENPDLYLENLRTAGVPPADLEFSWPRLVRFLGQFHPLAVHFPIALAITALLCEALLQTSGAPIFRTGSRILLYGAAISTLFAVPLGFAAAWGDRFGEALQDAFFWHRAFGLASGILLLLAAGLRVAADRGAGPLLENASRILLVAACAAVALAGYNGGILVFGPGHFRF